MPDLIGSVFAKLNELATDKKPLPETLTPAVPIRRSVTDDYMVCLKRHLMTTYGMSLEEYRAITAPCPTGGSTRRIALILIVANLSS